MSTYVDSAVNPKTGKYQKALFIDDYFGSHRYGVAFKNDGGDADLFDTVKPETYSVYLREVVETEPQYPDNSSGLHTAKSNPQD